MSLEAENNPSQIYNELQALQKQRRQAELKLREIDAKRRPGPPRPVPGPFNPRDDKPGGVWGNRAERGQDREHGLDRRDLRAEAPPRPHPWDVVRPSVQSSVSRPLQSPGSRTLQSAVSRPNQRGDDEDMGDGDEEEEKRKRRKRKSMEDEEEEDEEAGVARGRSAAYEDRDRGRDRDRDRDGRRGGRSLLRSEEHGEGRGGHGERKTRRVDSAVSVGGGDAASASRADRTPQTEKTEVKKRNRKMFGNLLGHLQKAKKQVEEIQATPTMQKRAEIESQVETRTKESTLQLREQAKIDMREERRKNLEAIREIRTKQAHALHLLSLARADSQCKALSCFIRTKTGPPVFWAPKGAFKGKCTELLAVTQEELAKEWREVKERLQGFRAEEVQAEEAHEAHRQRMREEYAAKMESEDAAQAEDAQPKQEEEVDPEADEANVKKALGAEEDEEEAVGEEIML